MAEKKKPFDLGNTLADILGSVPGSDTGREQITYLDINVLDADKENFYSMEGLDELAVNIELVGLQQPLRVRENPDMPGRYLIVSGHRRRAAIWTLYEEDPERWGSVPCIIEPAAASAQLQQLRLIYANAGTRQMSSADTAKQAAEVERLLYELKEQGYDFPGRMRDHVAEACKVSKTRLATLKVIRDNLISEWKRLWEGNKINETCAYAIAQQPADVQRKIAQLTKNPDYLTEWRIVNMAKKIEQSRERTCERSGGKCTYADALLRVEFLEEGCHSCSSYKCCLSCYNFTNCKFICSNLGYLQLEKKREKKAARQAEREAEKNADAVLIERAKECWSRFGALRRKSGKTIKECTEARGDRYYDFHNAGADEEHERGEGKWSPHTPMPWGTIQADDVNRIIATADLFGCSTDYLLGRAPEPTPAASEHIPAWKLLKCEDGWKRAITAADAAGVDIKEILAALFYGGNAEDVRDEDAQAVRDFADGGDAANVTDLPWEFPEELIYVADLLHCSTDYLLGRSPEPTPAPAASAAEPLQFRSGHPDHDTVCWCIFAYGEAGTSAQPARWMAGNWYFYNISATIDAECLGWIELPDYEGVLRK